MKKKIEKDRMRTFESSTLKRHYGDRIIENWSVNHTLPLPLAPQVSRDAVDADVTLRQSCVGWVNDKTITHKGDKRNLTKFWREKNASLIIWMSCTYGE